MPASVQSIMAAMARSGVTRGASDDPMNRSVAAQLLGLQKSENPLSQAVDDAKGWIDDSKRYVAGTARGLAADAGGALTDFVTDHFPEAGPAILRGMQAKDYSGHAPAAEPQAPAGVEAPFSPVAMKPSAALKSYMKDYEGFSASVYSSDGANTPTIGWGHKLLAGDMARYRQAGISAPAADALFEADLKPAVEAVQRNLRRPVTQNQFDALVTLAFNAGVDAVNPTKSTLMRMVNAGDFQGAADQFRFWNHANKKTVKGLTVRRASERKIFTDGIYDSSH